MEKVNFEKLIGTIATLYGSPNMDINCFQLGSVKFEVKEDESDGYRRSMDEVVILSVNNPKQNLLAEVVIENAKNGDICGWQLRDTLTGHIWLTFGTNHSDSYYPSFVFDWQPYNEENRITDIKKLLQ